MSETNSRTSPRRILNILEEILIDPDNFTAKKIGHKLKIPLPTIYRHIETLCEEKYLVASNSKKYLPGPKIRNLILKSLPYEPNFTLRRSYLRKLTNDIDSILNSDTVNMVKIDDIINEKIDLIKIDIEGSEYKALKGSINLIKENLPTIFSEFTPTAIPAASGVQWDEYLNLMINLGYKINIIDEQLVQCDQDINKVFKIFEDKGIDHLDLIFYIDK